MNCLTCCLPIADNEMIFHGVRLVVAYCSDECQRVAKVAKAKAEALEFAKKKWQEITPPRLQSSDDGRNGQGTAFARNFQAVCDPLPGAFVVGPSRAGKSWSAYQALKRPLISGQKVEAWRVAELSSKLSMLHREDPEECGALLSRLRTCRVLLLDDIDKAVMTETFCRQLFDLIDYRNGCDTAEKEEDRRPMIITANVNLTDFEAQMEKSAAAFAHPMCERIRESCKTILIKIESKREGK